jgi:mono/diheme cytochrome c family protein
MQKLLIAAFAVFVGWVTITLSTVKTQSSFIREGHDRVEATRAALTGTACMQCHGPESGQTLPIRKSLNKESFAKHVRGLAPFQGFNNCPAYSAEQVSDAEIGRIFKIIYGR